MAKKKKSRAKKSTKLTWKKAKSPDGRVIYEARLPMAKDMLAIVGERSPEGWVVGLYNERTDDLRIYTDFVFRDSKAAKMEVQALIDASYQDVKRVANRDVGDIVLAAEQYYEAQQEELDAMKRGTPEQLSRARKRTKKTKEALEDLTGANRELYGAMGGGSLGAGLGALTGNPFAAAIGALVGSVVGSLIGRPSMPTRPPGKDGRPGAEGEVVPFRRPTRPRGYAANPK